MRIINPADKVLMQLLGSRSIRNDEKIRALKWTCKIDIDAGIMFHNFITGETILFKDKAEMKENTAYLYSHYFFVAEENDDIKLVEDLRLAVNLINQKNYIDSYKILTTTDCNARCSYCYELGIKKENMSPDTADKIVDYIKNNSLGNKATLSWFGGEPLINTKIIDHICKRLTDLNIEYSSVMTSNGYLFTPELIKRAKKEWKLNNIQITLDGTKNEYNRIKAYVAACSDPFSRVMDNINSLTSERIRVNIRLNMDLDNYDDICLLTDELERNFKNNEYISVYASGLFQDTNDSDDNERRTKTFEKIDSLTKRLYEKGLGKRNRKSLKLRVRACMADGDSHRGISPAGNIMKCEHHIFSMTTGNIFSVDENPDVLEEWKKRLPYEEICKDCFALPTCFKLKNCPVSHVCSKDEKNMILNTLKYALKDHFEHFKDIEK